MKPVTSWSFRPYAELYKYSRALSPYICRLEPGRGGFTVDFIDNGLNDNLSVASSGLYDKIADADHLVRLQLLRGQQQRAFLICLPAPVSGLQLKRLRGRV